MASSVRGKNSRGNCNRRTHRQSKKRQTQSRRITFKNNSPHGRLKLEGLPKVTVRELPQIMPVLRQQRLIQPQRMSQLHDFTRSGAFAKHLLDRIPWHDVNHQEYQRQNEPQCRKRKQEALQEVARHLSTSRRRIGMGLHGVHAHGRLR